MSATEPAAAPVVYSASNPAPQYPGQQVQSIPRAAFTINARKNPSAGYALIAGLIAIFFNILLVPSVVAIVFGVRGLTRARQLAAEGEANTLRSTAVVGIVLGVTNLAFGVFQALVFIGAVSLSFFAG